MDTDIHKQRRNLIGVSLGLVIFELSSGKTESITFLGGGIKLSDGQTIITIAYVALAYLLWRYWLYAKPLHQEFRNVVQNKIIDSKSYRDLVEPLINAFKDKAGIAYKEGWDAYAGLDTPENYTPIPVDSSIEYSLFNRQLIISVENPKGEYHPDKESHKISYIKYETIRLKAWLSAITADKTFSDLFIPYALSFLAVAAAMFREFYA